MRRNGERARWRHLAILVLASLVLPAAASGEDGRKPDVLLVTVDTLRYDRLSAHGYRRLTSPNLDALLEQSARFEQMRVVEPLTAPSMVSMITSLHPQDHAASRNGLRIRSRLGSLPKVLARNGYETAAFIGNWTLRDELCGLGEHFASYNEIMNRKRWFGLFKGEATAEDLTAEALAWIEEHVGKDDRKPFLAWVHYVEPHAPYRLHEQFVAPLGITLREDVPPEDRYDTEVAFVDHSIGILIARLREFVRLEDTVIVFTSDHGESLGEHDYWGHGRHLYDVTLRVPMAVFWDTHVTPRPIDALASNLDVAPTLLGLLDLAVPEQFQGYDWSPVLLGQGDPETGRVTSHQTHKGVTKGGDGVRQKGLLEVGLVGKMRKETLRLKGSLRRIFHLDADPYEKKNQVARGSEATPGLREWLERVQEGLQEADELPAAALDAENLEKLKALGYVDN